jgi:SAM-dependent methyltransferase
MNYIRRLFEIIKNEGIRGLYKRLQSRTERQKELQETEDSLEVAKQIYFKQADDFKEYISELTFQGIENFYWYHTVELKNGIVTPGDYDYRNSLGGFNFPDDMSGMKVLDVGSATGFFAFEFERRGADVVSVELPSLYEWDMIHDERENNVSHMVKVHRASNPEEAYYRHLDGPFKFCHADKQSSVERVYSSIYDLGSQLDKDVDFDLVFLGDILLHLFSPFTALDVIAPLCKSKLIISTDLFESQSDNALMQFLGTMGKGKNPRTWWNFNKKCIEKMLVRVGFKQVILAGEYSGIMRRTWSPYHRYVFHATK